VSEPAPRPASGQAAPQRPQPAQPSATPPARWEDLFRGATPAQQSELLSLAARQGVLYAHQLPPVASNGAADPNRHFLAQLLAGRSEELDPVRPRPIEVTDAALDDIQREAVARAVTTPDLCLIEGLPGTGKSRVVAEIVTQAALGGERVLLVSMTPAAIDRVLEQVGTRPALCPLRCLGKEERVEELPAALAALTFARRVKQLTEQSLQGSCREAEAARQRLERLKHDEPVLAKCREMAEQHDQLEKQETELADLRSRLAGAVEAMASRFEADRNSPGDDTFSIAIAAALDGREEVRQRIAQALAEVEKKTLWRQNELEALKPEIESLLPLAEAKQQGRWWTQTWWQATLSRKGVEQLNHLKVRQEEISAALAELEKERERLGEERETVEQAFLAVRERHCDSELGRRLAQLDEQEAGLRSQRQSLQEKWQQLSQEFVGDFPRPAQPSLEAVQAAQDAWRRRRDQEEKNAAFAGEWADCLKQQQSIFPRRLAGHANLVAATTTSLPADPQFGDTSAAPATFDLLVLEEANLVTESEFLSLARRARRWVLVGEPRLEEPDRETRRQSPRLPMVPRLFHRLWEQLHCEPRRLPYAWYQENGHWCCRFRVVPPEQTQFLERECVADFPEVELRILALPRTPPTLAEVIFPPSMTLDQAKEYIFKELQELPVQAAGRSLCWSEETDRLRLRLSDAPLTNAIPVKLEHGVREMLAGTVQEANGALAHPAGLTCCIEFDRSAGWDRPRAETWVRSHLGLRDLGRTVRLDIPYRMHPDLALLLSDWLFAEAYGVTRGTPADHPPLTNGFPAPVEFVAVPPLAADAPRRDSATPRAENGRRGPHSSRPRVARGGAGLEVDLSDPKHRDRLPAELRPGLPNHGLVNFLEAQAVVRVLESLAADAAQHGTGQKPSIAVLALYPAQVELIRCLVARAPSLARAGLDIQVALPGSLQERECDIVLLSLTRSHSHRAVTYGEGPHILSLAMTRARRKLILFGDPGTLARRSSWEGPVDHLDESAAARERALLARMVRYVHGDGGHPRAFHLREGKCT